MKYGDPVIYIKDGKPINGVVLTVNGDLLSILYADPESESLAFQGNLARIAQVARSVRPIGPGMAFGWAGVPMWAGAPIDLGTDRGIDASTLPVSARAALESAATAAVLVSHSASEQLDEAQGSVPAGDPESAHAIGGTPGSPHPDGGTFGIGTSTSKTPVSGGALKIANPSEAAPTTEVGEPQTTTSETTQASSETHSEN